jgi:hypothetical protein
MKVHVHLNTCYAPLEAHACMVFVCIATQYTALYKLPSPSPSMYTEERKYVRFAKVSSANSNMGIVIVIFIILKRSHTPILSITQAYTPCPTCTRQLSNSSHPIYTYSPHAPLQIILIHLHPVPRIIRARPLMFQRHNRAVDPLDIRPGFRPCLCYAFHRGFDA